jgi:hypothetical protein
MPETMPDRASDSGPEEYHPLDWRDWLDDARENALNASRAEADEWKPLAGWNILATSAATAAVRNRARLRYIRAAREALDRAEELLR